MGVVAPRAKRRKFLCGIFTVPRKGSRGTLGTTYTMLRMDIQYTHLLHREDQARLSLSAKLHVRVSYSAGSCWGTCPSVPGRPSLATPLPRPRCSLVPTRGRVREGTSECLGTRDISRRGHIWSTWNIAAFHCEASKEP